MPLDEIKQGIEADARSEAASIHDSAALVIKGILDEAAQKANAIESDYEKETAKEIARLRQDQAAEIGRTTQVSMLKAMDESIRRESKTVQGELADRLRKSEHYGRLFKEAMKKAQDMAPENELVVQVNKNDEHFVKSTGAQIEHANISGLVIYSKDKRMKIDATLDTLVDSSLEDVMTATMSEIAKKHPIGKEIEAEISRDVKAVAQKHSARSATERTKTKKAAPKKAR